MKELNGYFSSFDGTKLFYRSWVKNSHTSLFIIHGFGGHSGRYGELIDFLDDLPLSIFIYDLRGHGKSEGERVYAESYHCFIKDTLLFRDFIEAQIGPFSEQPIFLGQSFGGSVASLAALEHQEKWQSLILTSPYFAVYLFDDMMRVLVKVLDFFAPKMMWENPIKPIFLTHDQKEVGHYKTDPLIQRRITTHIAP